MPAYILYLKCELWQVVLTTYMNSFCFSDGVSVNNCTVSAEICSYCKLAAVCSMQCNVKYLLLSPVEGMLKNRKHFFLTAGALLSLSSVFW